MENFEDDHGPVHDLTTSLDFQIARLRRRNLVVDENRVDFRQIRLGERQYLIPRLIKNRLAMHKGANLLALADTQITRRIEAGALLHEGMDDLEAQRLG